MYDNGIYVLNRSLVTRYQLCLIWGIWIWPNFCCETSSCIGKHDPRSALVRSFRNRFTTPCFVLQPEAPDVFFCYISKFLRHLMILAVHCIGNWWLGFSEALPARGYSVCLYGSKCFRSSQIGLLSLTLCSLGKERQINLAAEMGHIQCNSFISVKRKTFLKLSFTGRAVA